MRSLRAMLLSLVLVLGLIGAYSAYWYYASGRVGDAVADWIEARRAQGYEITHEPMAVEGFPTLIRVSLPAVSVAAPEDAATGGLPDGWAWHADGMVLEMQPWDLHNYRLDLPGTQSVAYLLDGQPQRFRLTPRSAFAIGRFHGNGRIADGLLEMQGLTVENAADQQPMGQAEHVQVQIQMPETPPTENRQSALDIAVAMDSAEIQPMRLLPLGGAVTRFHMMAEVMGAVPAGPHEAAVVEWRDHGGTVELPWFNLVWGPLDLRAKGTASLDEAMRPLGALTADIRGYSETLTALEGAGMVNRESATAARLAMELMAKREASTGDNVLSVPMTAQDGALFVGPIRLFPLGPIRF